MLVLCIADAMEHDNDKGGFCEYRHWEASGMEGYRLTCAGHLPRVCSNLFQNNSVHLTDSVSQTFLDLPWAGHGSPAHSRYEVY